ncbi:MAG: S-adenosylmethionine decarboxylase [Planctomycetota bacterium]|jgi:S-adenosylmethionine decarboxylase
MERRNLLFECHGGPLVSGDAAAMTLALERIVGATGLTILGRQSHDFKPAGATAALMLSESHLTAHSWPEDGYVAIDLFTCSSASSDEKIVAAVREVFQPTRLEVRRVERFDVTIAAPNEARADSLSGHAIASKRE